MRGGFLVVEILLLLPRGVGFEHMLGHIIFLIFPFNFEGGCCVAVAWRGRPRTATALAHPAGAVVRPRRSRCVEWEPGAMARALHRVGGCDRRAAVAALAHPAGPVDRPGHSRCVEWEGGAMAQPLRCVGGCIQPGSWRGRLEGSCGQSGSWRGRLVGGCSRPGLG
jgi:hypothetical protein